MDDRPDIDNRLNDIIVNDVLELLTACVPNTLNLRSSAVPGSESLQALRSAIQFHVSYGIANTGQTVVYFPIHIKGNAQHPSENRPRDTSQDHWLLVVFQLREKRCIWLDSLPCQDHYKKAESMVKGVIEYAMPQGWNVFSDWTNEHPPTMQQLNGIDCGVAVLAHALYHLCGRADWPLILESTAWRSVLLAIIQAMAGASTDESQMTQVLAQTCDLESQLQVVRGESQDASRRNWDNDANGIDYARIQHQITTDTVFRTAQAYEAHAASIQVRQQVLSMSSQLIKHLYALAGPQVLEIQAVESQVTEDEIKFGAHAKAAQDMMTDLDSDGTDKSGTLWHPAGTSADLSTKAIMPQTNNVLAYWENRHRMVRAMMGHCKRRRGLIASFQGMVGENHKPQLGLVPGWLEHWRAQLDKLAEKAKEKSRKMEKVKARYEEISTMMDE